MIILSIDPGYERMGIALIERSVKKDTLLYSNCFKTKKTLPFPERLKEIGEEVEKLIKKFNPSILAIESLLFFKNHKTVMGVSEAKGVVTFVAKKNGLDVFEYTPLQIKIAVTGYGRSEKNQVISMVKKLIKTPDKKNQDDEFDAIAVGLTCLASIKENIKIK